MKTFLNILTWVIGIMFILTGISKFAGFDRMSIEIFHRAGYSTWFFYLVAFIELSGGILLLLKRYSAIGAILIISIMLGAISTHLYLKDHVAHIIAPVLIILFSLYAAWVNRKTER